MNTLVHADIFFFISTIGFCLIALLVIIALIFIVKILKDLSEITKKVKEESSEIIEDVHALREDLKSKGFGLRQLVKFLGFMFWKKRRSRKIKEQEDME